MRYTLKDKSDWHKWFAWYPVFAGDTLVWLETVDRIVVYTYNYNGPAKSKVTHYSIVEKADEQT